MSRKYDNSNIYVVGNNAVKLEGNYSAFKETRVQHENQIIRKKAAKRTAQRRNQVIEQSDTMYTLILTLVIIATLAIVMLLLKTQFIVSDNSERIIDLQLQLMDIRKSNDQIETEISKSIDMNGVYAIATGELGMIQPTEENIRYIETADTTYTVQYIDGEVIEKDEGVSIGNVLGFISKGW